MTKAQGRTHIDTWSWNVVRALPTRTAWILSYKSNSGGWSAFLVAPLNEADLTDEGTASDTTVLPGDRTTVGMTSLSGVPSQGNACEAAFFVLVACG